MAQTAVHTYSVPASATPDAINLFARQSNVRILFPYDAVAANRSPAVDGVYSEQEALDRILAHTNLQVVSRSADVITLAPASVDEGRGEGLAVKTGPQAQVATNLDDVVVTARKREERAIDIPVALTVTTGAQIERRGANSLVDFLQEAPGVGIYDNGSGRSKITIRGISAALGGNENGYYLDDLPFTGVTVPIVPDVRAWDLDRVEVLRGPQGTLFGEGSIGGTVRILTKGPDLNDWELKGMAFGSDTAGSAGQNYGVKGAVNLPIIPDVLALRAAGTHERYQGWIDDDSTGSSDVNEQRSDTWRVRARFDPNERLSINGSYWSSEQAFPDGGSSATDDGQTNRNGIRQSSIEYETYGLSARYQLAGAELFYGYAHNDLAFVQSGRLAGQPAFIDIGIGVTSHEARISTSGDGPLQVTAGAYMRTAERADVLQIPNFGIDSNGDFHSQAYAAFGEATYEFPGAPVDLTAGLRYFEEDVRSTDTDGGVAGPTDRGRYNSLNPRFAVAWHPVENATIYASAAKGFRSGQIQGSVSLQLAEAEGVTLPRTLRQDSIWSYELGAKAELFDRRLTADAAVFFSEWKDVTASIPIGDSGLFGLTNSDGTRTRGFEISLVGRPMSGLTLAASGAYIDGEYVGAVEGTQIFKGTPVDEVPKFTANLSADYRVNLQPGLDGFGRIGWQHNSRRDYAASSIYSPGDVIDNVDARIGVDLPTVTLALFVDNLTNENGSTTFRTTGTDAAGLPQVTGLRLRPRTIGFEASFRLGASVR